VRERERAREGGAEEARQSARTFEANDARFPSLPPLFTHAYVTHAYGVPLLTRVFVSTASPFNPAPSDNQPPKSSTASLPPSPTAPSPPASTTTPPASLSSRAPRCSALTTPSFSETRLRPRSSARWRRPATLRRRTAPSAWLLAIESCRLWASLYVTTSRYQSAPRKRSTTTTRRESIRSAC